MVQDWPPVDVIRTVLAVTAPLLAEEPKALTQSPTATSVEDALCVELTVVELEVVIVSFWVFPAGGVLGLPVLFEFGLPPAKFPSASVVPETDTVEPLTAVTLPFAKDIDANCLRKLLEPGPEPPEGKLGRVPLPPAPLPPPGGVKPPPPPPKPAPPPGAPPVRPAPPVAVHEPFEAGVVTVILRAAMVVLDFFETVPVTETQSPAASALTASDAVLENCVVDVQLTAT